MKLFKRVTAAALAAVMVIANANFVFGTEIEEETDEKIEEIIEEIEIENEESLITEEISPDFSSSSSEIVASGYCGGDETAEWGKGSGAYKNLWWELDKDGVLTIGGTGEMKNYSSTYDSIKDRVITGAPWGKYVDQLKTLVIEEDITSIGENAFYNCSGFTGDLVIGNSVTSIGKSAFSDCSGFTGDLVIPDSVISIGYSAFRDCSGFTGDFVIPDSVTSIGDYAFYNCSGFTGNLVIPDSVTSIGKSAFSDCSGFTGDLVIPDSVTSIGEWAFYNCYGFTGDLVIGDSVKSIGNGAFLNCHGFTGELVIPDSVTSIGKSAFNDCSGFTGDLVIPDSVTSIGEAAFNFCSGFTGNLVLSNNITSIEDHAFLNCHGFTGDLVIPNSVTSIGFNAFSNCYGFTGNLVIPDNVTSIGLGAFIGTKIESFTVGQGNSVYKSINGMILSKDGTELIMCPPAKSGNLVIPDGVTSIGEAAFCGCSGFTGDLVIGNNVTSIGIDAFYGCSGFTGDLVIGNNVTSIGSGAFDGCSGFTGDLVIGNNVTSIGEWALHNCSGFTGNLVIPDSVTSIGELAFYNCSGLTGYLVIGDSVKSIGECAFAGTGLENIYFKGNAPEVTEATDEWHASFDSDVTLYYLEGKSGWTTPTYMGYNTESYSLNGSGHCGKNGGTNLTWSVDESGVLKINGTGKMEDYDDVEDVPWKKYIFDTVIIEEDVTSIGRNAFNGFKNIKGSLSIPDSVISISSYAFYNCTGFDGTLDLGNGVKSIGAYAFANCNNFTGDLVIPDSTIEITNRAFYKCSGFNGTLTLGNSLKTIEYEAFCNCSGFIGNLIISNSIDVIEQRAFYNCKGFNENLVIGNKIKYIDYDTFYGCSGFTGKLNIPDNVEAIYGEAFYNCSGFESLKLPAKLSSIWDSAFRGCKNLSGDIVIAANATIGNNAFTGCTKLENIYFMGNAPEILDSWSEYASFEDNVTFYYVERMEGWSSPEYHGYKTATWTPDYTVTFNANGGEGAPESQIKIANTDLAISNIVPTRFGYNFKWWRGSDGFTYNPGDLYITNSNLVLTAVWVRDETIDAPRIIVSNAKGMAGSIVNVDVKLKNNPGISGIGAELIFDSSMLEFVGAQIGSGMAAVKGAYTYAGLNKNGTVTLNWNNPNFIDFEGDYVFATVSFRIREFAKVGDISTITVQCKDDNIYDSDKQNIDFLTENGTVGVTAYTPGDIDGNGNVSNKDVAKLFNYISKKNVEVVKDALDVNGDGSINNRDVITLFYYVSLADVEIF